MSSSSSSSVGFGDWYEDKKSLLKNGDSSSSKKPWFGRDSSGAMLLPLSSSSNPPNHHHNNNNHLGSGGETSSSWNNALKMSSLESQMPKQIWGLGYAQRFRLFCALLILSALFFLLAFFVGLPLLATRPQKFAISFTLASISFMAAFAILRGPMEHCKTMLSADRIYFTVIYVASIFVTLYFTFSAGGLSGYLLVLSTSAVQLLALSYYLISFLPGGPAGLKYVTAAMAMMLKPIILACTRMQAFCFSKCRLFWRMTLRNNLGNANQ